MATNDWLNMSRKLAHLETATLNQLAQLRELHNDAAKMIEQLKCHAAWQYAREHDLADAMSEHEFQAGFLMNSQQYLHFLQQTDSTLVYCENCGEITPENDCPNGCKSTKRK
jgi:RNA polymerase-binding transcription factor DksA